MKRPTNFWSCFLRVPLRTFDITQEGDYDFWWAALLHRPYRKDRKHFAARDDHDSMKKILKLTDKTENLVTECLRLFASTFNIGSHAGIGN